MKKTSLMANCITDSLWPKNVLFPRNIFKSPS